MTDDSLDDDSLTDGSLDDGPPIEDSLDDGPPIEDLLDDDPSADDPLCVLVVEDNAGDVRLIEEGLDASPVRTSLTVVNDGEQALESLLRRADVDDAQTPDLVLLDLNVPKMTGIDVLERIGEESALRSTPIVVFTGSRAENHVIETARLGADGYFVKPVDPDEFTATVARFVESIASSGTVPSGEYTAIDCSV